MKSSLRRLRGFALHRSEPKEKRENQPPAKLDELVQAAQDVQDLRSCYDGLLSAAAATANSAYEFSEALHEMGTCLLKKAAINDDEDCGPVALMLGKAQFELERLADNYRSHIIQTITTPSERLLRELQIVEDMKQQCDDKRDLYKLMLTTPRKKGKLRNLRGGDAFTPQQLQAAREDYEEEANLFVFRLKSLKQGQSRSLFTQVARHHAAQLNFFRKGLKSLELIEPHVRSIAERQHIEYHFSELEDDDMDYDSYYHDSCDDGDLSFDYGLNQNQLAEADDALSTYRNSILENVPRIQAESLYGNQRPSLSSKSAPILADTDFNFSEKIQKMPPPSTKKFHTYVLPTPTDIKNTASTGTYFSSKQLETNGSLTTQISYSSPLGSHKLLKYAEKIWKNPTISLKSQTRPEDSTIRSNPTRKPAPSSEDLFSHRFTSFSTPEAKMVRRYAFSGPITGKSRPNKPFFTPTGFPKAEDPTDHSKMSHSSHSVRSTLRISELHELPRPPSSLAQAISPRTSVGHSAPLVSRNQQIQMTGKVAPIASETASSSLPTPPAVLRSFSIPYRGRRTPSGTINKLPEAPRIQEMGEEVNSPPLTPLSLKVFHDEK